jgi:diadenosine tetraphosphate (Ap4A) HIT family hydrolase
MSFALPVERLYENATWLAFWHPSPAYPFHILLVAKQPIANLQELVNQPGTSSAAELIEAAARLVERFDLQRYGYRLVANGGPYQDIPQLHFHLISESREVPR